MAGPHDFLRDEELRARLARATEVLDEVARDRRVLAALGEDERRRFLELAGRVSRPERDDQRALARVMRKKNRVETRESDARVLDATGIRALRRTPLFVTPDPALYAAAVAPEPPRLGAAPEVKEARKCYVCKAEYRTIHHFYDQLCPPCAELNLAKRTQSADLGGRVAVVTGSRVKIGYFASLMLLRAGAHVVATTRFPLDSAMRYAREPDYEEFRDRLDVHGLDLRHTPSVEVFARHLEKRHAAVDFVVNNACQTVRRPAAFYAHMIEAEARAVSSLGARERRLLASHAELRGESSGGLALGSDERARAVGLDRSAMLSQLELLDEDRVRDASIFPEGALDRDLQQIDLREKNSWRLALAEVPTVELLEVLLVNAVAPFVLNAKLRPLLAKRGTRDQHVVNVSAMEGQFYRAFKTDKHPHTNMAKAALNMMTRTSAVDYAKDGIWMNSVDTGWITDEDPAAIASRKVEEHGFHPPLDAIDGAARILDPIFHGFRTGEHVYGQFLKDYVPVPW